MVKKVVATMVLATGMAAAYRVGERVDTMVYTDPELTMHQKDVVAVTSKCVLTLAICHAVTRIVKKL